ncbi:MAG TPA: hypothetical protein VHM19_03585 [Polyangiales bacterium]|jgi:hypothetical protein|nr:hypothetical protein [Polyangiales bacterium]
MTPEQAQRERELRTAFGAPRQAPPSAARAKPRFAVPEPGRICIRCGRGPLVVGHKCWDHCGVAIPGGMRCLCERWSVVTHIDADGSVTADLLPCFDADLHVRPA